MSYIALTLGFTALFAVLSFHKEYKTTWSILCAVVFVLFGVINYNTLPVLQWWGFEGVWIEAFIVSLAGAGLHFDPDVGMHVGRLDFLSVHFDLVIEYEFGR